MITKSQKHKQNRVYDWTNVKFKDDKHTEKYLITTWYFLFIPVFKSVKLIESNL
jgi:hypothetical protein